jgi:hypothetical protein
VRLKIVVRVYTFIVLRIPTLPNDASRHLGFDPHECFEVGNAGCEFIGTLGEA